MDSNNEKLKILYKCMKANTIAICCTYHRSSKQRQEPHKIAYLSENGGLGGKSQENGPKAEKDKTERATGLGRRTREEI